MQPGEDEDDEDDGDSDTTLQMGPRELDEERLGIRSVSPADSDAQMAEGARMPDAGGQRGPPHREAARGSGEYPRHPLPYPGPPRPPAMRMGSVREPWGYLRRRGADSPRGA